MEEEHPIFIASYNVGLTSRNVLDLQAHYPLSHFYLFSERLEKDLIQAFAPDTAVQALFLCELGSQNCKERFDLAMTSCHKASTHSIRSPA